MPIETMDPAAAHAALSADDAATLVDVRTVQEFDAGHPAGAVNVPWAIVDPGTGQMAPNPRFVSTMQAHFPAGGGRLFLSCAAGMRSMNACRDLEAAGYADLVNVDGGFGGRRNPVGQVVVPGWQAAGLPVDGSPSDYASREA